MTIHIPFFLARSIRIHGLVVDASHSESGDTGLIPAGC